MKDESDGFLRLAQMVVPESKSIFWSHCLEPASFHSHTEDVASFS